MMRLMKDKSLKFMISILIIKIPHGISISVGIWEIRKYNLVNHVDSEVNIDETPIRNLVYNSNTCVL